MRYEACRITALLSFSFLITNSTAALAQGLTPLPGPHAVGLHIVSQVDAGRGATPAVTIFGGPNAADTGRPMQTLVWYPAQTSGAAHVHYLDYLQSGLTGDDFKMSAADLAKASNKWTKGPPALTAQAQSAMLAVRDARAAAGSFPVVIYAPSFDAGAAENADLCEYLASRGYIVLASASRGGRYRGMTDDLEGVEAQRPISPGWRPTPRRSRAPTCRNWPWSASAGAAWQMSLPPRTPGASRRSSALTDRYAFIRS